MNKAIYLLLFIICLTVSCSEDESDDSTCKKWELEINNPEATVVIQGGKLIVDITNPTSSTDVRLIQRQPSDFEEAEVAMSLAIADFQSTGLDGASRDAQISISAAYQASANAPFVKSVYGIDQSRYFYEGEFVTSMFQGAGRKPDEITFYVNEGDVIFQRNQQPLTVNAITTAPKVFYLDFGIDPSITREEPTANIHIEIELMIFEDYTQNTRPILLPTGAVSRYGVLHDDFDCNSL